MGIVELPNSKGQAPDDASDRGHPSPLRWRCCLSNRDAASSAAQRAVAGNTTIIELLVTLSILAIVTASAPLLLDATRLHINEGQLVLIGSLRLARANAINKSLHYQVTCHATQFIVARMAENPPGSGTWVPDPSTPAQTTTLPSRTHLIQVFDTVVEFNARGFAVNLSTVKQLDLQDDFGVIRSLQIWPSGQVNELYRAAHN